MLLFFDALLRYCPSSVLFSLLLIFFFLSVFIDVHADARQRYFADCRFRRFAENCRLLRLFAAFFFFDMAAMSSCYFRQVSL